jgi:hypothetical protein
MNRVEFTKKIINLLALMFLENEYPIIDYAKRSDEEQNRLFKLGLSQKDGFKKQSAHQVGKAVDLYFIDEDDVDKDGITQELVDPKRGWEYWHKQWEDRGGQSMIEWDKGHFEG